ncbi:hypothetical protein IW148_001929 [Coemansia sp. RSA 1199]|nr:hypothetical protein IW148_001929 [Coemansia sp. RSA 1199]
METESSESAQQRFGWKIDIMNKFRGKAIIVVLTPAQARIAEDAGAGGVIPIDLIAEASVHTEGTARSTDLNTINNVMDRVVIPVIGRVRVGHVMEAKAMEFAKVTCIDENEFLNPITTKYDQSYPLHFTFTDGLNGADGYKHTVHTTYIYKQPFKIPFLCGAADLGEALKQIQAGASMIRTKMTISEDSHDVSKTFENVRKIFDEIELLSTEDEVGIYSRAELYSVDIELVRMIARDKRLPVPFFAAGGIFMPIDAAMLMSLGCNGVIVSSRAFKTLDPETRIRDIVTAVKHYREPARLARIIERTGGYGPKPKQTG